MQGRSGRGLKSERENMCRPSWVWLKVPVYPALARWANLFRPSGLVRRGFSLTDSSAKRKPGYASSGLVPQTRLHLLLELRTDSGLLALSSEQEL